MSGTETMETATSLLDLSTDDLAFVFANLAMESAGKASVLSLIAIYRQLHRVCRAFAAALPHVQTPFDGAITASPSRGSSFLMRFTGGVYHEELPVEEDALVLPQGETAEPFGLLIIRDSNHGSKLKCLLTERIEPVNTHPDGILVSAECLDLHRVMRLLSCEDDEFRMVQAQSVWPSAHGMSVLLEQSGKIHLRQTGHKCIANRAKALSATAAQLPLATSVSSMVDPKYAILAPALRYTWCPDGTRVAHPTGRIALISNVNSDDADEKAAVFEVSLLASFGTHEPKDLMRRAGVKLLDDVPFPDKIPTHTNRSTSNSEWYIERMEQARSLREKARRDRAIVSLGGRVDEREAARHAAVMACSQAEAESVLDSRGRRPNYELTIAMVREEETNGWRNADYAHSDDSDSHESEDSDSDYEPAPKKKRATPPPAPRVRPVSAPPLITTSSTDPPPLMLPPSLTEEASVRLKNAQKMALHWAEMMEADSDSD